MLKAFRIFLFASFSGFLGFFFALVPFPHAAEYPTKTVQIINPFPPGAITDILARLVSDKLSSLLGQPVVVVNKTGGVAPSALKPSRTGRLTATRS